MDKGVLKKPGLTEWVMVLALILAATRVQGQVPVTNRWEVQTRAASDSSPALGSDGTVYFGTQAGVLWALTPEGARKWVFQAGNEIKSSPAVGADGAVYFGSRDRRFYALTPAGEKKWEFKTGGWVDSSPALSGDGTICFGSWDGSFYALNPDGSRKWQFDTGGVIVSSAAVGSDGTLYFGSHDGNLYALAPGGKKKWAFATRGPIISSPALGADDAVYFTSVDGFLYALNSDGSLRWRLRTGGITQSSPVIGPDGTLCLGVNDGTWGVTADGKKKWADRQGEEWRQFLYESSPLMLADGSYCIVSSSGQVLTLAGEQRQMQWGYWAGPAGDASPTVSSNGTVYLPIIRVGWMGFAALATHTPLARTPWPKFRGNLRNTGNVRDATP